MPAFKIYTDDDGENHFSTITEWGSYPAVYLSKKQEGLCPYCACERFEMEGEEFTRHPIEDDDPFCCDDCGCDILEKY